MVKTFSINKMYYINGVLATLEDLKRLFADYYAKNIDIVEIKHTANFCWIKTN